MAAPLTDAQRDQISALYTEHTNVSNLQYNLTNINNTMSDTSRGPQNILFLADLKPTLSAEAFLMRLARILSNGAQPRGWTKSVINIYPNRIRRDQAGNPVRSDTNPNSYLYRPGDYLQNWRRESKTTYTWYLNGIRHVFSIEKRGPIIVTVMFIRFGEANEVWDDLRSESDTEPEMDVINRYRDHPDNPMHSACIADIIKGLQSRVTVLENVAHLP